MDIYVKISTSVNEGSNVGKDFFNIF